jgi:hypothetical protein
MSKVHSFVIVILWWFSLSLIVLAVFMIIAELDFPGEHLRQYGNQTKFLGEYSVRIEGAYVQVPAPKPEAKLSDSSAIHQAER